jgi:hypothetical protein
MIKCGIWSMESRVEEGKVVRYGDGENMESVKMTKYEKRGEMRGKEGHNT